MQERLEILFEIFVQLRILHSAVNVQHCCKEIVSKDLSPLIRAQVS